jgi:hypothetical protein
MKFPPRQKTYFVLATFVVAVHLGVAAFAKPSFRLTMFGDALPCVLLILAILAARENFRGTPGILPVFWKIFASGLALILLSQSYWCYFDSARRDSISSPVLGDALFLLAHAFFLSALALRPHSASAGGNLRIRKLDFVLLALWWFSLYAYFSLPWQVVIHDVPHYNPTFYRLAFIQHLVIIAALVALCVRQPSPWRGFYFKLVVAFVLNAAGTLLLSVAINVGWYYAGSLYDTPFLLALYMFTFIAGSRDSLQPHEDRAPNRELAQSVWTARIAMLGILSLPFLALLGLYEKDVPASIAIFRLRLIFGAMLVLGVLAYWKISLLARELVRLVTLTRDSIENLKAVQRQVTHSEKLVALGRLTSGAAHEISNPLTAILGYSELLADLPLLSPEDRASAQLIQQQVHQAQAAVNSLRNTVSQNSPSNPPVIDKNQPS